MPPAASRRAVSSGSWGGRGSSPRPADEPQDEDQDDGSYEGDENCTWQPWKWCMPAQLVEQPTADERADDADDDVRQQAVAADHQGCKNASHQADDDPGQDVHLRPPLVKKAGRAPAGFTGR